MKFLIERNKKNKRKKSDWQDPKKRPHEKTLWDPRDALSGARRGRKVAEETGAAGNSGEGSFGPDGPNFPATSVPDNRKGKYRNFSEEIANSASGGAAGSQIASLGIPNPNKSANFGEPGVSKTKYKDTKSPLLWPEMMRRTMPNMVKENRERFAGAAVFEVDSATFHTAKFHKRKGKHWRKYLGEDDCLSEIRDYANKNPGKPIIIKNKTTGEMCYARYGKGMKYVTEM